MRTSSMGEKTSSANLLGDENVRTAESHLYSPQFRLRQFLLTSPTKRSQDTSPWLPRQRESNHTTQVLMVDSPLTLQRPKCLGEPDADGKRVNC